jgi:hypothetical protein
MVAALAEQGLGGMGGKTQNAKTHLAVHSKKLITQLIVLHYITNNVLTVVEGSFCNLHDNVYF